MGRDWPAQDIAPLIALVDDPRHRDRRGRHLPPVRGAGARHPRPAPAAPHRARPRRDRRRAAEARGRDLRLSRHPALARRASSASSRTSCKAIREAFATPRRTEILDWDADVEDEDLIQREDMVVTVSPRRLHQARAALDLPGAAPRRQGPLRHGDAGRGFRHAPVRRQHPHAGAVLLLPAARPTRRRSGGCRSRRRTPAARRSSTCCRSSRASASPRSCRCPRTRRPGSGST